MGSIIHPWNLVMLFVVTSVAAMVHSDDVMDVGLVTDYRPEQRGDYTNKIQQNAYSSTEDITGLKRLHRQSEGQTGEFNIDIQVMAYYWAETYDDIFIKVEYRSGRNWGEYECFDDNFRIGTLYSFTRTHTYYGVDDKIKTLHVKNEGSNGFFPQYVIINAPEICDRYKCDWEDQCDQQYYVGSQLQHNFTGCFVEAGEIHISCHLANADPGC